MKPAAFKVGDVVFVRKVSYRDQNNDPYQHREDQKITFLQLRVKKTVIKRIEAWKKSAKYVCVCDEEYSRVFGTLDEVFNDDIPVPEEVLGIWRNQVLNGLASLRFNITKPMQWSVNVPVEKIHFLR